MRYERLDKCIGERLAFPIKDNKILILGEGTLITANIIERLKNFGISYLCIEDENSFVVDSAISEDTVETADLAVKNIDIDLTFKIANKMVEEIMSNADFIENGYLMLKEYDENTSLHSVNVSILSTMLGMCMGLDQTRLKNLAAGTLLHDIGKTKVPIHIIGKKGKLTEEEYEEVKKHSRYGYEMLKDDVMIPIPVKAVVYQHHENWDGSGYPRNLKGDDIYILASIAHVCDVFDALISRRSYKDAFSYKDSIDYLKSESGKMFMPMCVDYLFKFVPIFKTGVVVKLSNNEEAIICKNHMGDMANPTVKLLSTKQEIDLREHDNLHIIKEY